MPAIKPAAPTEHKTSYATYATGISSILFAVVYGQTDGFDVSWLPAWSQSIVIVLLPTLATRLASWWASHTPRPDLATPVGGGFIRGSLGVDSVAPTAGLEAP